MGFGKNNSSPLNEKRRIRVPSRAIMETGVSRWRNFSSNHGLPFNCIIHFLEKYPCNKRERHINCN